MTRAKASALSSFARAADPPRAPDGTPETADLAAKGGRSSRLVRVYLPPDVERDAARLARQLSVDLDGVTKADVLGALIRVGQDHLDEVRERLAAAKR